jgi:photosystem II stability/assembly factor-like uncharacterized protein
MKLVNENLTSSLVRTVVMSTVLCLSIPVCASFTLAQTGPWSKQRTSSLSWLHALYFLDQNRGWAVGSKGTILVTTDGGLTWQSKSSSSTDVIRDIIFLDEKNGWLVCEVNLYELKTKDQPRAYLMRTTDGGEHWQRVDIKGIDVDARLVRAVFSSRQKGWIFGEAGLIYMTDDGGESWKHLLSPTRHLLLGGMFVDEFRGWLVGAGGTIIQTSDGGETWYQARFPQASSPIRFAAACFVDNRLGWAVGSGGAVYRTDNGGRTWQPQETGIDGDLLDVKFLNSRDGWAVGNEGMIISTNDGGQHWVVEKSGTDHPLERVFFVDRNRGWAVGFGGTVVSYVRKTS